MSRFDPDPEARALNDEREHRLERDSHREPRVALRKVTDVSAERAELLALNFASAFYHDPSATGEGE